MEQTVACAETETLRVSSLRAFAYCRRLFYLEEVEELYTQNESVFAGRRLHAELQKLEREDWQEFNLESVALGLRGRVDALRTLEGHLIPYEHKIGRSYRDRQQQPQAWYSDKVQILAYACLLETVLGVTIPEGRIHYHRDNVTVRVPVDDAGRQLVRDTIEQARQLRASLERPPICSNEKLCLNCSLAPVCLPEEGRLAHDPQHSPLRLFPRDDEREIIHVTVGEAVIKRAGEQLRIAIQDEPEQKLPIQQVGQVVIHKFAQITTPAIHLCAHREVGIHFISSGGRYIGSIDNRKGSIQRRIRQYQALTNPDQCLRLAQLLVNCRGQSQRRLLLRGQRNRQDDLPALQDITTQMERLLSTISYASSLEALRGIEGNLAALYFSGLPYLLGDQVPKELRFNGRNRRPPKDPFNALLSFGYGMLLKDVMNAILTVGLEPAFGFYHQPRTQAPPLALDLMEIFRVPLVDMVVIGSINRMQWNLDECFEVRRDHVWLSDYGRRKFIELYEARKGETWKHPVTNYSLTYRRLLELEVRLLEKEWCGEAGLFGKLILR
ncbi:type I-MYXAN CRISPR-associated endonuclease Cas1 [Thermosynechococcus sp. HN-54]|uniref:type I-MYXAN CRISPR-associated endonuclease Cas4/Cas1 n=1 Tax=Thermosynechococcus sp. HN-54 TaxID=2933959 RepID=UPI00202CF0B2|nr:type I-MYXAN CRISPR-associated endonuclease Cas1 [Thermosynechococcus sp. HN-54]URR34993.1 type I-MYXAN CRISPR-associated endonuclease Cas1 [Thermosynechococcus sp. HN-54]